MQSKIFVSKEEDLFCIGHVPSETGRFFEKQNVHYGNANRSIFGKNR
jgi:hypothetical protein